jgi:hypothetical protein
MGAPADESVAVAAMHWSCILGTSTQVCWAIPHLQQQCGSRNMVTIVISLLPRSCNTMQLVGLYYILKELEHGN